MATIAPGLNFRIGADVKGVQKAIREAEKSLRGAVQSFSSIGNALSLGLTAPLAAFGVMSIKAAGDMENLRLAMEGTMKGAGRSINEARNELEELRKVALAPGIDFEQAVKGSIRLQSVGFAAERARGILVELANALALSGGTADQLDGVTRQFAQMSAKGKVMQEDLRIILENMPTLGEVIKKEFGTTTAEGLRDLGVSADEFIDRITKRMNEDLPRAAGGISNALVNAGNAITQALADVGGELNRVFGISQKLNDFSEWVMGLSKSFRNLDEGTKRLIVGIGVFAAALGPAFKLMQGGVFVVGKLHIAYLGLQKLLAQSMAGQAIPNLITKWRALDFVMKASVIGAIAAVVLAAAAAFYVLSRDMSVAAQAAQAVEKSQKAALDSISAEKAEIEILTGVVKNNAKSKEERKAAMDKLIAISPEYRKAIKGEIVDTKELDKVTANLVQTMIRKATADQAITDIAEIDKQLRNLKETSDPSTWQTIGNAIASMGHAWQFSGRQAKTATSNYNETREALTATRAELLKVAEANMAAIEPVKDLGGGGGDAAEKLKLYKEVLSDIANVAARQDLLGGEKIEEQAKAIENGIKRLLDGGFRPMSKEVQGLKAQLQGLFSGTGIENFAKLPTLEMPTGVVSESPMKGLTDSLKVAQNEMSNYMTKAEQLGAINKKMQEGLGGVGEAFQLLGATFLAHGEVLAGIGFSVVGTMEELADAGEGIAGMAQGILGALKKIIGGLIKTGVAAVVTKALLASALNPFAALALGAAAGALAQGLFNSVLNKIKIPALAEGGVLTSPQLVMAGEYAGARNNPEIVAPESKMRDVFADTLRQFGGAGGGTLTCKVSGDDLLFVLQKAEKRATRIR